MIIVGNDLLWGVVVVGNYYTEVMFIVGMIKVRKVYSGELYRSFAIAKMQNDYNGKWSWIMIIVRKDYSRV